jgi:hypothetical protein
MRDMVSTEEKRIPAHHEIGCAHGISCVLFCKFVWKNLAKLRAACTMLALICATERSSPTFHPPPAIPHPHLVGFLSCGIIFAVQCRH